MQSKLWLVNWDSSITSNIVLWPLLANSFLNGALSNRKFLAIPIFETKMPFGILRTITLRNVSMKNFLNPWKLEIQIKTPQNLCNSFQITIKIRKNQLFCNRKLKIKIRIFRINLPFLILFDYTLQILILNSFFPPHNIQFTWNFMVIFIFPSLV